MTIHITPEQEFSYVSFETNVASSDYGDLISRVIETFQPGKFVVTILANKVSALYYQTGFINQIILCNFSEFARILGVPCTGAFRKDP